MAAANNHIKSSILKIVDQKFGFGELVLVIFEAFKTVDGKEENRLFAIVKSGNSTAVFVFSFSNYPPITLNDLRIESVEPVHDKLSMNSDVGAFQFQLVNDCNAALYHYSSDDETRRSKETFERLLKKLTQEYSKDQSDFTWLQKYKNSRLFDALTSLEMRKSEYTVAQPYKIYCGTWNVNLNMPNDDSSLSKWLANSKDAPDIYAIGLQEINMSAKAIIKNETQPDYNWVAKIMECLHPGDVYEELTTIRLVGLMLTVAIKTSLRRSVSRVSTSMVGTGKLKLGNKGGIGISFQINEMMMCFVNCHLAAHVQEFERRNEDHDEILKRMLFNDGYRTRKILEHHHIFWFGDLNYRLVKTEIENIQRNCDYEQIFYLDQLHIQRTVEKRVFRQFQEGKITFKPTYKYDPGTDNWDSSEKNRAPAWCDRILWNCSKAEQIAYNSVMDLRISDHKPVYAVFIAYVSKHNEQKYKEVCDDALKIVRRAGDKCLNENVPKITVAETDLDFGVIRFHERKTRELLIANCSYQPVQFEFRPKDSGSQRVCEDWIKISHLKGELITGNSLSIQIDIFIDESAASKIVRRLQDSTAGVKVPLDILVMHVENGRDIFITIFGEYQPSVFGLPLDMTMKLEKPVLEYSLKELVAIDSNKSRRISYYKDAKAPREIWLLIDFLFRHGLTIPKMFNVARKQRLNRRICAIRDWLDAWSWEPFPGTPQTAAEALLKILESLPEPLVNISEQIIILYGSSYERCCELLQKKLPVLNCKIFLYIIMFLKEIQNNYSMNRLDDQIIVKVFSPVMFRHVNYENSQRFLLQFLTNDIKDFVTLQYSKRNH